MTPEKAKNIADKKNKPLVEKFWKHNTLEDFFYKNISKAASKGSYHFDFFIPETYSMAVAKDVHGRILELGYKVEVEATDNPKEDGTKERGWAVRIIWD